MKYLRPHYLLGLVMGLADEAYHRFMNGYLEGFVDSIEIFDRYR